MMANMQQKRTGIQSYQTVITGLRRLGAVSFLFFLAKGLAWIALAVWLAV